MEEYEKLEMGQVHYSLRIQKNLEWQIYTPYMVAQDEWWYNLEGDKSVEKNFQY